MSRATRSRSAVGQCQRSSSAPGHIRADDLVADEPSVGHRGWLAEVVEQCREPDQRRFEHGAVDRPHRVIPEVLARDLVLRNASLRCELGRDVIEQSALGKRSEPDRWPLGRQQQPHLRSDPLAREVSDELRLLPDRLEGRRIDREVERGREPRGPKHAERVLTETRRRVADRAERPSREVAAPAVRIDQPRRGARLGAPGDGVHGEVAPGEVELDRVAELDPMRTPEVRVVVVGPERRDLDVLDPGIGGADRDRAERVLVDRAREQTCGHLGQRRRGQVPVLRFAAGERVAQRTADDVRGMAGRPQPVEQVLDGCGERRRWIDRRRTRVERQFLPRNRYVRHASLRSSARYGVKSE